MSVAEYLVLAVASIFWPLLFTIVLLVLRTDRPVALLGSFLAGGLLACIAIGLTLVVALDGATVLDRQRHTVDPVVNLVAGLLALAAGLYVRRRAARPPRTRRAHRRRPWNVSPERMIASPTVAFAAGVVLNVVPGLFPFVALKNLAEADYGLAANIAFVIGFYLIMFVSVEVPLAGYLVAPDATVRGVRRWNEWLDRNTRRIVADVLVVGGALLVLRAALHWLR